MSDYYRNVYAQKYHLDKDNPQGYLEIAKAEYKLGNIQNAISNCTRAIEVDPFFVDAFMLRGVFYTDIKEYNTAFSDFDTAVKIAPDTINPYSGRATAYFNLEKYQEAIEDTTVVINRDPSADSYFVRGIIYFNMKLFDEALEDCNRAIDINPEHYKAYCVRSDVYYEKRQYEKAGADLAAAKKLDSTGENETAYKVRADKIADAMAAWQGQEAE
jgi:tetratricopeptide (TPR) repeat protein